MAVILMVAAVAYAVEKKTNGWKRPGKNDRGTVQAYRVKQMMNGDVRIYKYGDPFNKVGHIKNGLPTTDKRRK